MSSTSSPSGNSNAAGATSEPSQEERQKKLFGMTRNCKNPKDVNPGIQKIFFTVCTKASVLLLVSRVSCKQTAKTSQ